MNITIKEKRWQKIREDYQILSRDFYPSQKPGSVESSRRSLEYLVKTRTRLRFFIVYQDSTPILIAPLRIRKNCVSVFGTLEQFNMSDFVYDIQDVSLLACAIKELLLYLKKRVFHDKNFSFLWWYLYDGALSYKALQKLANDGVIQNAKRPEMVQNVQIPLPDSYDSYFNGLSKHARQNVRTAYNRISRDNHTLAFHLYSADSADPQMLSQMRKALRQYTRIYLNRLVERYHYSWKSYYRKLLKTKYNNLKFRPSATSTRFFVDVTLDGEIAAYAKCYTDKTHRKVMVPELAIDKKWGFYSPGLIVVNELAKRLIQMGNIDYLSLGRGEEAYKYVMGGEMYKTWKYEFTLV